MREYAEKAVSEMNGKEYRDRRLRVNMAMGKGKSKGGSENNDLSAGSALPEEKEGAQF